MMRAPNDRNGVGDRQVDSRWMAHHRGFSSSESFPGHMMTRDILLTVDVLNQLEQISPWVREKSKANAKGRHIKRGTDYFDTPAF